MVCATWINVVMLLHYPKKARRAAMAITTLSSREFNQDTGGAKKAAKKGPVFITVRVGQRTC